MEKKTLKEIRAEFKQLSVTQLPDRIAYYEQDERAGVQKLLATQKKRYLEYQVEVKRSEQMKVYENSYAQYPYIAGIDEVGRGPLAGPVVACAVILPKDCNILYINDSKQVSEKKREKLCEQIKEAAVAYEIGMMDHAVIDEINILQATYKAMQQAIQNLSVQPDLLLNDAVTIPEISVKQVPIIKGDTKSISIAAASIVAKVTRDAMMVEYDKLYPEYGFAQNKGYGSPKHLEALRKYGPCPIHRKTFIRSICG